MVTFTSERCDGILELPDELLAELGWKEGDALSITTEESGDLILRRVNIGSVKDAEKHEY